MYKIVKKKLLAPNIVLMEVKAPRTAKACLPGQFVIVKADEKGERIPLTVCDYDRAAETVTIVFQTVGNSTKLMAEYEVGDSFRDFVGPLGCPSDLIEEPLEELKKKRHANVVTPLFLLRSRSSLFLVKEYLLYTGVFSGYRV